MARLPEEKLSQPKYTPTPTVTARSAGLRVDDTPATPVIPTQTVTAPQPKMVPSGDVITTTQSPANVPRPAGKKIVGYIQWKHPVSGAIYNVPRYDDGTDARSEWGGGDQVPASFMMVTQDQSGSGSSGSSTTGQRTFKATDGKVFTDLQEYQAYQQQLDAGRAQRQSAYDLLYQQFKQYGLESLVAPLKGLIEQAVPDSEFTIRLRESDPYKKRFAANQQRIAKGLRALSEAEYIGLEDQYQNVMRQYGLPESYYTKGEMGVQPGFEKFLAGDVSPTELEDRIQTAQNRVINAAPEIKTALQQFYPGITNGDILAYTLDPQNALTNIKRKIGAAEIGGAALQAGLETGQARAEELQRYGVTQAEAQQKYQAIGGGLQRGTELASIYSQSPYTQTTAEQEVFGLPSAAEAGQKRKKLIGLERATFGGQTGAGGAFERERAGGY